MNARALPASNGSAKKIDVAENPRRTRRAMPVDDRPAALREQVCSRLGEEPSPAKKPRKRRAWQPGARDHFIYHLVKFEGHSQSDAASMQRLSQATVSRVIQRYERWQAHADPREGGRLDPAERLRAQRWLTYERNELILGTALRIARAVEGKTELWKTVNVQPGDRYQTDKASVRDETTTIDRTGVAARFLRLAFKVNMEQLALVEKEPAPMPAVLRADELAEEERQDAAADADFRAQEEPLVGAPSDAGVAPVQDEPAAPREQVCSRLGEEEAAPLNLHNLHHGRGAESSASDNRPCTCAGADAREKNSDQACMDEPARRCERDVGASTIRYFPATASASTLPPVREAGTRDKEVAG
jgi:hypothetical protein